MFPWSNVVILQRKRGPDVISVQRKRKAKERNAGRNIMLPPPKPQLFPRKPRNKGGKSKKKAKITLPPSSDPIPSPTPPPPPPPTPPPPPPPPFLFRTYPSPSSTSSTPLPPPSMPRKRFLRRIMPLLLVGSGAYALMRNSEKELAVKDEKLG
ncbi:sulfated surface glycoprotein 185-like isoform X2 [Phoenix dactylifera]|uniref:Sulfated surface glycoprotein 185-like isoform X2 n=1 Tax=Phoenix dactylifera TaxID=42345 RepID=A0A8B7CTL3_PHODC|nr:sulfated surface glycoprotein 185-like isoform X2 [Phoenix dactylifera]